MSDYLNYLSSTVRSTFSYGTLKWVVFTGVPLAVYLCSPATEVTERSIGSFYKQPVADASPPVKKSGSIDGFYRKKDTRDPKSFKTFLKAQGTSASTQQAKSLPVAAKVAVASSHHVPVVLLYGTEFGFSKEIAEKLHAKLLETDLYWPTTINMADHPNGVNFAPVQVALVMCSTQGDGVPPSEARDFCDWLFAGKAGKLPDLQFSVCALGDKSYSHFCQCGKQVDAALLTSGASCFVPRVDVNKEDWRAIEAWMQLVITGLAGLTLKPLSELGDSALLPHAYTNGSASHAWGRMRPYIAAVKAVEPLCTISGPDDKNTIRVEIDLGDSGLAYSVGDALGIIPANAPQAVSELLAALGASGKETLPRPSWAPPTSAAADPLTSTAALAGCYDLRSPKAEELWAALRAAMQEEAKHGNTDKVSACNAQLARLAELSADPSAQEAYLSARHVIDVLRDFPAAKLTLTQILPALRALQPRLYSISSSPLEAPASVQITVAEVKYTSLNIARGGVASTHLSERTNVGSILPVYVARNPDFRLPSDPATPIIMVGPGTGLAPFRAFIQQRLLERDASPSAGGAGEMVLFFGCRRRDQDYLYGAQLEAWAAQGQIQLFTAFSREQSSKVYVQDRVRQAADLVWKLLHDQGGHFYVCGDAASMAGAVEQALLDIISERLPSTSADKREGAQRYLDNLSAQKRYSRDVWY